MSAGEEALEAFSSGKPLFPSWLFNLCFTWEGREKEIFSLFEAIGTGNSLPPHLLLCGPPSCGKTLLTSQYISRCNIPYIYINCSLHPFRSTMSNVLLSHLEPHMALPHKRASRISHFLENLQYTINNLPHSKSGVAIILDDAFRLYLSDPETFHFFVSLPVKHRGLFTQDISLLMITNDTAEFDTHSLLKGDGRWNNMPLPPQVRFSAMSRAEMIQMLLKSPERIGFNAFKLPTRILPDALRYEFWSFFAERVVKTVWDDFGGDSKMTMGTVQAFWPSSLVALLHSLGVHHDENKQSGVEEMILLDTDYSKVIATAWKIWCSSDCYSQLMMGENSHTASSVRRTFLTWIMSLYDMHKAVIKTYCRDNFHARYSVFSSKLKESSSENIEIEEEWSASILEGQIEQALECFVRVCDVTQKEYLQLLSGDGDRERSTGRVRGKLIEEEEKEDELEKESEVESVEVEEEGENSEPESYYIPSDDSADEDFDLEKDILENHQDGDVKETKAKIRREIRRAERCNTGKKRRVTTRSTAVTTTSSMVFDTQEDEEENITKQGAFCKAQIVLKNLIEESFIHMEIGMDIFDNIPELPIIERTKASQSITDNNSAHIEITAEELRMLPVNAKYFLVAAGLCAVVPSGKDLKLLASLKGQSTGTNKKVSASAAASGGAQRSGTMRTFTLSRLIEVFGALEIGTVGRSNPWCVTNLIQVRTLIQIGILKALSEFSLGMDTSSMFTMSATSGGLVKSEIKLYCNVSFAVVEEAAKQVDIRIRDYYLG